MAPSQAATTRIQDVDPCVFEDSEDYRAVASGRHGNSRQSSPEGQLDDHKFRRIRSG